MKDIYEIRKARIIVKSPIHIGSVEQKLTPFEFIRSGQYFYQLSEEKLSLFLQKRKLIDAYVSSVSIEGHRFKLLEFFKNKGITLKEDDLIYLSGGRKTKLQGDASKLAEYRPFIKDGFSDIFVPGTSIKGVIRTAILYNLLKEFKQKDPEGFKRTVEQKISQDIDYDSKRRNKKRLFQWGNERWLEGFILGDKNKSPNTDWLRMLHISDAYSSVVETTLIPASILKKDRTGWTYKKENSGQNTAIWVECLSENTAFEFKAVWDNSLLEEFKRYNRNIQLPEDLNTVFSNVNSWSKDVADFERRFSNGNNLENWYKNNSLSFRIGFGSGMISTTIAMLLNEDLRKKVRNYSGLNRQDDIAPKSRRVWVHNNITIPFGWAVFEVV